MRIAIFGHSYVRDLQSLDQYQINLKNTRANLFYFSFPGACFKDFFCKEKRFKDIVSCAPNIVIVLLGGNDIKVTHDLNIVKEDCKTFFLLLKSILPNSKIIASQIEHRHLKYVNKHQSPKEDLYRKLANCYNRWLVRQLFKDKLLIINGFNKLSEETYFKSDGVHLNLKGLELLFDLIVKCVDTC